MNLKKSSCSVSKLQCVINEDSESSVVVTEHFIQHKHHGNMTQMSSEQWPRNVLNLVSVRWRNRGRPRILYKDNTLNRVKRALHSCERYKKNLWISGWERQEYMYKHTFKDFWLTNSIILFIGSNFVIYSYIVHHKYYHFSFLGMSIDQINKYTYLNSKILQ